MVKKLILPFLLFVTSLAFGQSANRYYTYNTQASGYTFVLSDANTKIVQSSSLTGVTFTIDETVTFPVGSQLIAKPDTTGMITVVCSGCDFQDATPVVSTVKDTYMIFIKKAAGKWDYSIGSSGGSVSDWGDIGGTLSDQTDLQAALDAKQNTLTLGTNVATALAVNVGTAGSIVINGGALGTPSSGTGTNLTGIPQSGVTSLTSDLALKAPLASPTFTGTVTIPTPSASSNTTVAASTAFVKANSPKIMQVVCSDQLTAITTGTTKRSFRVPFAMTLTGVRAYVTTAQASGSILTFDINESGSTILSTKLTIDNTETTSVTAATPAVISDTSLADDSIITVDVDQIGNGTAIEFTIELIGY